MKLALAIIIPLVLSTIKSIGCIPISAAFQNSCSMNFGFEFNGRNWFGVVKLEPQIYNRLRIDHIKLNLTFSTDQLFPEFQNLQLLHLYKSLQDTYKDIAFQHPIIYRINSIFDYVLPVLSRIQVNDIEICNLNVHAMTKIELEHSFYLPTVYTQKPEPQTGQNSNSVMDRNVQNQLHGSHIKCGIFDDRLKPIPMVSMRGSSGIAAGAWPWLVGIFRKVNRANLIQRCTGSLITNRMVLTAAHCFKFDSKFGKISSKNILLAFGRFDIRDWTENDAVNSNVKRIILHPDHMRTQEADFFDSDIAFVITERFINFNARIRPICLWPTTNETPTNLIGKNGTVVSWGHPTDHSNENSPRRINLPIVNNEKCFPNDKIQRHIICAGTEEEGHTTCKGDSGSGFAILMNKTWFLRGIVSGAISDSTLDRCGLETYIIFTDITRFQDWIAKLIQEWSTADFVS